MEVSSYAGGLDVFDPAIAALFAGGFRATLLGGWWKLVKAA
jgi:hypothetical protein